VTPRLRDDDRALPVGLATWVAILMIGAFLFVLLNPAATQLFDAMTSHSQTVQGQDQIDLAEQIWGLILFFVLFMSSLWLLVRAIRESETGRGA